MALTEIRGGATLDIPTQDEIRHIVSTEMRVMARGIKNLALPVYLSGKASSNAITLGITKGQSPVGPEQGYVWGVTRLVVSGLTQSASAPDIVNLYLNDNFNGPVFWQFNGNTFGYNYSPPLILKAGNTLALQNVGSIASTSLISLSGEVWEVPAEMEWRLLVG